MTELEKLFDEAEQILKAERSRIEEIVRDVAEMFDCDDKDVLEGVIAANEKTKLMLVRKGEA